LVFCPAVFAIAFLRTSNALPIRILFFIKSI
jgi:hypothetical protein